MAYTGMCNMDSKNMPTSGHPDLVPTQVSVNCAGILNHGEIIIKKLPSFMETTIYKLTCSAFKIFRFFLIYQCTE